MKSNEIKVGDKVTYDPGYLEQEGIVKSIQGNFAFVVYDCNHDWDNYQNYTWALTSVEDLKPGWEC